MRTALAPALAAAALAALVLAACGSGAGETSSPAGARTTGPGAAPGPAAGEDGEPVHLAKLLEVLDGLPSQDDLDAAAAARITEATAEDEYQKLKAEIDADLVKPAEDG